MAQTDSKFKLSFMERLRIETFDNSVTLSRDAKAANSYLRVKTSLMGQWFPSENVEAALRLTNEFRNYFAPVTNTFHMNEVFIDQLYIKINTKAVVDGMLTAGRQNITLGEGFVVMDGSPLDGSRCNYFNALRFDWNLSKNNTLTFLGIYDNKDDQLPVINGKDIDASFLGDGTWRLLPQSETGLGVYYTGRMNNLDLQGYYIRKDYVDPDRKIGQAKSSVNTLGGRLSASLCKNFASTVEAAYQVGKTGDNDKNAYGGYAYVDYMPLSERYLPKSLTVGTIYLSGNDPNTKKDEGWDPIFSRWPKWSESFIYTQIKEFGGPAYWSNLASVYLSVKFNPDDQTNLIFDYHHLLSSEDGINKGIMGTGNVRGDLFVAKVFYEINKNMSGHVIFEHFIPGNYYFKGANVSNWARFEFLYKI
jgi:hypothetical protein